MDSNKQPKSLYDASVGEVAIKNFFAGFMHGLGGFFVTLLSWVVLYFLLIQVVMPQFQGMLTQAGDLLKSVEKLQNGTSNLMKPSGGSTITIPPELLKQFQQAK